MQNNSFMNKGIEKNQIGKTDMGSWKISWKKINCAPILTSNTTLRNIMQADFFMTSAPPFRYFVCNGAFLGFASVKIVKILSEKVLYHVLLL